MLGLLGQATQADADVFPPGEPAAAADFGRVLLHASETPGSPYFLHVSCTGQAGIRSLELFPGDAAIWNGRSQIMLPPAARTGLLKTLVDRGFSGFEERYGGGELPPKPAAPARIDCRVWLSVESLEKDSVQMAGGNPPSPLSRLATELLDQAAPYTSSAVTPSDLDDALAMLASGQLFPQVLNLRFMDLPGAGDEPRGKLTRIAGGRLSRQAYFPGKLLEAPVVRPLQSAQFTRLVAAIQTAQFTKLPANLWSDGPVELEVRVLAHGKVVLARPFSRLESARQSPAQQRFETLLVQLRALAE